MSEAQSRMEICFVDSNIWLYALNVEENPQKVIIAKQITELANLVVSFQVINEVCANLLKKADFAESQIQKIIASFFADYQVVEISRRILLKASGLRTEYSLSFWDSLIVAAALAANAEILYSEDMQNGLLVENKLKIINPFL